MAKYKYEIVEDGKVVECDIGYLEEKFGIGKQTIRLAIERTGEYNGYKISRKSRKFGTKIKDVVNECEYDEYASIVEHLRLYGNTICKKHPSTYIGRLKEDGLIIKYKYVEAKKPTKRDLDGQIGDYYVLERIR